MADADLLALLVIVLCLIGSMFFSGAETAITSFGDRRARRGVSEGGRDAKALRRWVEQPVFVLSTILLGNNVTNTLLGATATALTIRRLGGTEYGEYAVPVAVVLATGLLLVFGEIVPKAIGRVYSLRLAIPLLRFLNGLGRITYPLVWLLTKLTELIIRRAVPGGGADPLARVTQDELDFLVRIGEEEGSIPARQAAMLQSIFRFDDKTVRDIMVPLDRVTAVDLAWQIARIKEVARKSGHSRIPVYVDDLDNVRGILHIKALLAVEEDGPDPESVSSIIRSPFFVSESLLLQDLLHRFKEQRAHLAVVVDDAGDTVGVVTLEDVIEQIVGQIFDETDVAPTAAATDRLGVYYLSGQDSLSRVEELFGVELEEMDGVDSIGDLLTQLAGQMPSAGSIFVWQQLRIKVLASDDKRILRVRLDRVEQLVGDEE